VVNNDSHYTIVIPFYNDDIHIKTCLESINACSDSNHEVIIVDNSDKPTNIQMIIKSFENVTVIETDPKIGFAKANNIGAHHALAKGTQYIICLNQDAIVTKNTFTELLKPFKDSESIIITSPISYKYDLTEIESFFIRWYLCQCPKLLSDAINGSLQPYYEMKYISGACFAIRANFVNKFGFFDPLYFMYSEDEDLCRKVYYMGYRIVITPTAEIGHYHSHTNRDSAHTKLIRSWIHESNAIFLLKDINAHFFSALIRMEKGLLLEYIKLLLRLDLISIIRNLFLDIRLHLALPKILKSRHAESQLIKKYKIDS